MTRKDFEAIALALKAARGHIHPLHHGASIMHEQWERDVDAIAAVFAAGNPRFDLARFRRACGWGE